MCNRCSIVVALAIVAALSFALFGCPPADNTAGTDNNNATDGDDHGHDDDHDHDGHDDDHDHDGHSHANMERHELGEVTVVGHTLMVTQLDHLHAGEEAVFEIKVTGGGKPDSLRIWVGVESGEGSRKKLAATDTDLYDIHVSVPATLPENAEVWLEVQAADGSSDSVSLAFHAE